MGYSCANCSIDFPTKREIVEHMHEKHNSTFLEGDWVELSNKLLAKDNSEKGNALKAKAVFARGD